MSTNHEHTPLTDTVREVYSFAGAQAPSVREQWFDRWHRTEIAAAEQRGAVKALRDAADEFAPEWPDKPDLSATRGVSQTRKWLHNRADQMEGDE